MNSTLNIEPKSIWDYFYEITQIPRPSKQESQIINYLIEFAGKHNLPVKKDAIGNIVISKPASKGLEKKAVIVLQSHMDMVCEKNLDVKHNFLTDPIQPYIDGEWVKATGTTLGADDGIGIAASLAILSDKTIPHGPLECLFTVDEETGLTGAFELQPGFITGNTLLNLDSEDEGEIFIGCAGGRDSVATFPVSYTPCDKECTGYSVGLTGLKGGHSGDDIHKGHANAIKLLNSFLVEANKTANIGISRFEGGNLRNAIPREAFVSLVVENTKKEKFVAVFEDFKKLLYTIWSNAEPSIQFEIKPIGMPKHCLDTTLKNNLLEAIDQVPNGVISWDEHIEALVKTSTNLASIKFNSDNQIEIVTSQRSSSDTEKAQIVAEVAEVFKLKGALVTHSKGYPGWMPNVNSPILKIATETYRKLFNDKAKVKAIHAGLECGIFLEKYPKLDMISIGPTIKGAHSPDERLHIPSVQKFWNLLLEIIR